MCVREGRRGVGSFLNLLNVCLKFMRKYFTLQCDVSAFPTLVLLIPDLHPFSCRRRFELVQKTDTFTLFSLGEKYNGG